MADKIGGTSRHDGSYTCCCLMMLHITILMDGEMNMEMSRLIFVTKQSLLWFAWRVCMEPGSPGKTAGTPGQREITTIFLASKKSCFPVDPARKISSVFHQKGYKVISRLARFILPIYLFVLSSSDIRQKETFPVSPRG